MTFFYILLSVTCLASIVYLYYVLPIAFKTYKLLNANSSMINVDADEFNSFIIKYNDCLEVQKNNIENNDNPIQYQYVDKCKVVRAQSIRWPSRTYFFVNLEWMK